MYSVFHIFLFVSPSVHTCLFPIFFLQVCRPLPSGENQIAVNKYLIIKKFLILNTYHPYTLYLHQQGYEDPWLFFEAQRGPRDKKFWKLWFIRS